MDSPILSLCIPTNGVVEWVFPVLDSIYKTNQDSSRFEVIVEDNGDNEEFEKKVHEYQKKYKNLKYYKSTAQGFLCQIDSLKNAKGQFIKFVNHRARLVDGGIDYLIRFAEKNMDEQPVVFFSNNQVKRSDCKSFNEFVSALEYWSSWSGGLAFWKEDIKRIAEIETYNTLFPHTDILFSRRNADRYIIDDNKILSEIDAGHGSKGKYNLFQAFAVEYLSIIIDLVRDKSITVDTFLTVKKSLLGFLAKLYVDFIIKKKPASYSFVDYKKYLLVYYSSNELRYEIVKELAKRSAKRILKR